MSQGIFYGVNTNDWGNIGNQKGEFPYLIIVEKIV